ncbi:methyltransferase domain-containing protein [Streptomyces sp. NPDC004232]|uniref:class I SAM-dependent methyltransferase n=1 Tax=Streptomyces sp. NPDC004232 TaxID=3154454 RepID=UPI0033BE7E10
MHIEGEEFCMLAKKADRVAYKQWNEKWGAPYGFSVERPLMLAHRFTEDEDPARYGPFGFQPTSHTREVEYPWAHSVAELRPGLRVMDVGGWLSGFQVVLAKEGCEVVNVDPSSPTDQRWTIRGQAGEGSHTAIHRWFTSLFDVDVTLVTERLQDTQFAPASFDRVFAISVLEHVDQAEAQEVVKTMEQLLVPGGLAVLSIDLFLDLEPFGAFTQNVYGRNLDVCALVGSTGMTMVHGDPAELHGFPEFDAKSIVARAEEFNLGWSYPVVSQLVVLRKPV